MAFGFTDLNLHRIALHVFATNVRAIKTYERAGFQHEGTLRDNVTIALLDPDGVFDREGLYGTPAGDYPDNAWRFAVFSRKSSVRKGK